MWNLLEFGLILIIGLLIVLIQLRPRVSWFEQFKAIFAISFFVSIPWNWLYLFKEAYAKHQSKIMNMEILHEQCERRKNLGWFGSFVEWIRTSFTLKDDPCQEYARILVVDPIFEVSPIKPIVYTFTTFIIEPLKALGEGMGGFFQALLKDLPFVLWIPVLIIIAICSLGTLTGGLPAVFHQQVRRFLPWLAGDLNVNAQAPIQHQNNNVRSEQMIVFQNQTITTREGKTIQISGSADRPQIEEVPDAAGHQGSTDERNNISIKSDFEDQQEMWEEVWWSTVTPTDQAKGSQPKLDYLHAKNKKVKAEKKGSHDEPCGDTAAPAPWACRRNDWNIPEIHSENVSAQKI